MTLIPQKDVYRKPYKKKRVFIEKEEELPNYEELFEKILKKSVKIYGKSNGFKLALYSTVYIICDKEGNLNHPNGWINKFGDMSDITNMPEEILKNLTYGKIKKPDYVMYSINGKVIGASIYEWCNVYGKYDTKKYVIHHIDKNVTNNKINNLLLMPVGLHIKYHNIKKKNYKKYEYKNEAKKWARILYGISEKKEKQFKKMWKEKFGEDLSKL